MVFTLIHTCSKLLKTAYWGDDVQTCLTFQLSGLLFGIRIARVKEILRCGILAVPRDKPPFLRGFYRHQGRRIPVLDLTQRYSGQTTIIGGRTCLIIVDLVQGRSSQEIAILADEVRGTAEFRPDTLSPLSETIGRVLKVDAVKGIARLKRDYLVVLDVPRLLTREEFGVLCEYVREM